MKFGVKVIKIRVPVSGIRGYSVDDCRTVPIYDYTVLYTEWFINFVVSGQLDLYLRYRHFECDFSLLEGNFLKN
jgi:hypothetical protein